MRKIILSLVILFPAVVFGQFGVKGGLNFAKVSKAEDINAANKSGFHVGVFMAPVSRQLISSRSELIFSRQGYDYKTSSSSGDVNLDYIQLGQLMSINLTKYLSIMLGAQTAYLVSAKVDSTSGASSGERSITDLMNRIDYGYAVGVEGHPLSGLIVGIRYNVSLGKVYKDLQSFQRPSFTSEDAKNNLIQVSVGWRLGSAKK